MMQVHLNASLIDQHREAVKQSHFPRLFDPPANRNSR